MNAKTTWQLMSLIAFLGLSAATTTLRADFDPPADNVLSEKQVTSYIAATKEWMGVLRAAGKAVEANQGPGALMVLAAADKRFQEILAKNNLTEPEFRWVGDRIVEARGGLMMEQAFNQIQAQMKESVAKNAEQQRMAKARVAALEAGVKSGRRVLTEDEKKSAAENTRSEIESAGGELKQQLEEAKAAATEATKFETDARTAEALAAKPPPEIGADDKNDYIAARKQEATDARERSKEQRQIEVAAIKKAAETKTKLAALEARLRDPEATTPEEAVEVRKQNEEKLAGAREELKTLAEAGDLLTQSQAEAHKQVSESAKNINAKNLDLMRKHTAAFDAAIQGK